MGVYVICFKHKYYEVTLRKWEIPIQVFPDYWNNRYLHIKRQSTRLTIYSVNEEK